MKTCKRCNIGKDLTEYYKHSDMLDGYLSFCKSCTKNSVKSYRGKNIEKVRAYDRLRGRVEGRKKLNRLRSKKENMTEAQWRSKLESSNRWIDKNKTKRAAQCILHNAVKYGKIIKSNKCEDCNNIFERIEGHHEDYDYPLYVVWLCRGCHARRHRKYNDEK